MFFLNHSNEQTAPFSATDLQYSILIVPKRYQAAMCFPLSDRSTIILFVPEHGFAMSVLSQNIGISCRGVSIFSASFNRLEIMKPSTFLTAWLKPLGAFGEIFNTQVILCFDFGDKCPQMALLTYSLLGSEGVEDENTDCQLKISWCWLTPSSVSSSAVSGS